MCFSEGQKLAQGYTAICTYNVYAYFLNILGNRTIAVCTKLDLMGPGTDALDILYGRGNHQ